MNTINQGTYKPLGIIKSNLIPLTILLSFGLILFACNENHNPVSNMSMSEHIDLSETANTGVNTDPVDILGFEIKFIDTVYNNGQTTFNYTVTRGENATGFNYLFFETPSCAVENLENYTPGTGEETVIDGTVGIKWTASMGKGESRDYSITYSGNQSTGMTYATIQGSGSGDIETKPIPGPCKGVYTISGFIYVDENGDKIKNAGEGGIGNVTVDLVQNNNTLANKKTFANGSFSFDVFTGNTPTDFTLEVRESSNSFLFDNFSPTKPPELKVTMNNKDKSGNNLGFQAQTGKIIERFENPDDEGGILLQTEKPKFWANQFKFATKNRDMVFGERKLLDFLDAIDKLDLTYKFDFGDDPIKKAEQILTIRGNSTELDELRAELLAAALNVVSGGGAVKEACNVLAEEESQKCVQLNDFNDLILKVGAAAAVRQQSNNGSSLMMNSSLYETTTFTITSQSLSSGDLLRSFNGGGGGVGN